MERLLNFIFPPTCLFCERVGEVICNSCLDDMPLSLTTNCIKCNKPSFTGNTHTKCLSNSTPLGLFSLYQYKGPVRTVIRKSKYHQMEFSLLKRLVRHGTQLIKDLGYYLEKNTIVVPIPISPAKWKTRGFNQVEIITNLLAYEFKLKTEKTCLLRVKDTKPQYSNNRIERFENVQNAFAVKNEKKLKNSRILLVDDVSTSGATLLEAYKAFSNKGIYDVRCFVVAKKILRD